MGGEGLKVSIRSCMCFREFVTVYKYIHVLYMHYRIPERFRYFLRQNVRKLNSTVSPRAAANGHVRHTLIVLYITPLTVSLQCSAPQEVRSEGRREGREEGRDGERERAVPLYNRNIILVVQNLKV